MKREAEQMLREYGMEATFNEKGVTINGEIITAPWKTCWRKLKEGLKKGMDNNKKAKYIEKKMQSNFYQNQDVECGKWLINMQEQMIETRKWKGMRGLKVESVLCWLCEQYD